MVVAEELYNESYSPRQGRLRLADPRDIARWTWSDAVLPTCLMVRSAAAEVVSATGSMATDPIANAQTEDELLALMPEGVAAALRALRGAFPGPCPADFRMEAAEEAFDA